MSGQDNEGRQYGHLTVFDGGLSQKSLDKKDKISEFVRQKCVFVWEIINFCLRSIDSFSVPIEVDKREKKLKETVEDREEISKEVLAKLDEVLDNFGDHKIHLKLRYTKNDIKRRLRVLSENVVSVSKFKTESELYYKQDRNMLTLYEEVQEGIRDVRDAYLLSHNISQEIYQKVSQDLIQKNK